MCGVIVCSGCWDNHITSNPSVGRRWHAGDIGHVSPGDLCPPQLRAHHSSSGPVLHVMLAVPALPGEWRSQSPAPPPDARDAFPACASGLISRCSSRPLTFSSVTTVNYRITFCYSSSVKGVMTSLTFGGKDEVNGPRVHGKSSAFTQPVCFNSTRSHKRINWDKHSRYHSD